MSKTVAYVRVSSKDQNLDRQLYEIKKLGIEDKYIYTDKQSGKDFDRIGYQYMKKGLEKGDLLVIKSLDRFGRNYEDIMKEWNDITKNIGADIKVLDMELLDTTKHKDILGTFISDLVLQVLSFVAHTERENIKQRQKEGIASAHNKGVKFGRPTIDIDDGFINAYNKWKAGDIKAVEAMELAGMTKATFYRKVKEYENK
ncbi:recombinase family protein [Clostridium sp. P21]|uniref:Recombinase family protein n=1 Tax=Clostridium muellerianum TaxID=2716538 RepID=A0A7Y0EL95_9CLOT|nr:recombinase family protein [Clostridium muellerianum]NMM65544.1 recombinase family protein [Clostridium muellerianum]